MVTPSRHLSAVSCQTRWDCTTCTATSSNGVPTGLIASTTRSDPSRTPRDRIPDNIESSAAELSTTMSYTVAPLIVILTSPMTQKTVLDSVWLGISRFAWTIVLHFVEWAEPTERRLSPANLPQGLRLGEQSQPPERLSITACSIEIGQYKSARRLG